MQEKVRFVHRSLIFRSTKVIETLPEHKRNTGTSSPVVTAARARATPSTQPGVSANLLGHDDGAMCKVDRFPIRTEMTVWCLSPFFRLVLDR